MRRIARLLLLPAASVAVHELRYVLAAGGHARVILERQGHAYLHSLLPWIVLLAAAAVGSFLWALGRAFAGQRTIPRYAMSLGLLWMLCTACLLVIFVAQELLEGLLAGGHPAGLAGVFGYGGWWALPAALCVGLVLATILHGARWVLDEVARWRRASRLTCSPQARLPRLYSVLLPRLSPLEAGASGRGPPS
jgi:hypothetical protein